MNSWVCSVCGSNSGLRNMNDACEQPTADGSFCYGKVLYKEITEAQLYVIGETTIETDGKFKREDKK